MIRINHVKCVICIENFFLTVYLYSVCVLQTQHHRRIRIQHSTFNIQPITWIWKHSVLLCDAILHSMHIILLLLCGCAQSVQSQFECIAQCAHTRLIVTMILMSCYAILKWNDWIWVQEGRKEGSEKKIERMGWMREKKNHIIQSRHRPIYVDVLIHYIIFSSFTVNPADIDDSISKPHICIDSEEKQRFWCKHILISTYPS